MCSAYLKVLVILLAILAAVSCADNDTTTTVAPSSTTEGTPTSSSEGSSVLAKLGESLLSIPFGIVEAFKFGAEACADFWGSFVG